MANFDPTALLTAYGTIANSQAGKFGQNNLRPRYQGALAAFMNSSASLIPGLEQLKQSPTQPVSLPVFNKIPAGTETLRKCAGSGTGTTAMVPVVYQPFQEEFSITTLDTMGNLVTTQAAMDYHISEITKNLYGKINTAATAFLEANKATVNRGNYFTTSVAGAKQVPYKRRNEMFAGIVAEEASNDFNGNIEVIASQNIRAAVNYQDAQGQGNGQNLSYQFDGITPFFSNMTTGAGEFGVAYAYEQGTVGMFPWLRPDFRQGDDDMATDIWMTYELPPMPGMERGLEVELKIAKRCVGEAVKAVSYIFHVDIAFLSAYAQETGDTGIYKYSLLQAEDDSAYAGQ